MTEITNKDFRKLLKKFKNSPYLGYKSKQVHNEPTGDYLFPIKNITKLMKSKRNIQICTNFVKLGVSKIIGHINKKLDPPTKQ